MTTPNKLDGAMTMTDEQTSATIAACVLMIKGICLTKPRFEWTTRIEERIRFMLKQQAQLSTSNATVAHVPDPIEVPAETFGLSRRYALGWNDCRNAMLSTFSAAPNHIGDATEKGAARAKSRQPIYQTRWEHPQNVWGDVTKDVFDSFTDHGYFVRRIVYAAPQPAQIAESVGWFVRRSEFGPWIEVEQQERGSEQLYRAPQTNQEPTDDARDINALGQYWLVKRNPGEPDESYLSRIDAQIEEFKAWLKVKDADVQPVSASTK